jgi:hypothetical protein
MCALLESESIARSPTGEPAYQVVYIGHHSDALWKVGWVVHEGRGDPFSRATEEQISLLGCDLDLAQFKPERSRPLHSPDRARDLVPLVIHLPGAG